MLAKDVGAVLTEQAEAAEIAILFGREDSGLTNEELQRCHTHLQIPSSKEYGSLNLAMAVQVVCYEIFQYLGKDEHSGIRQKVSKNRVKYQAWVAVLG